MPDIRQLTDDEREQLKDAPCCQDSEDAGPGDDDFDKDGGDDA